MSPATPSGPQKYFVEIKKEEKEEPSFYFSLDYIRENALELLGEPQTAGTVISGDCIRYISSIPWVEFNIGINPDQSDKWRRYAACNSESSAEAVINYFLHLRDACEIKSGKQKYKWNEETLMFIEVKE